MAPILSYKMKCFITGTPHHHPSHPDYVPTILSFGRDRGQKMRSKERFERRLDRVCKQREENEKKKRAERGGTNSNGNGTTRERADG